MRTHRRNSITFGNVSAKHQTKTMEDVVLKAYRNLFSHMILVDESRQVNMKDVLAHPLGPLPWALVNPDGILKNKAALARNWRRMHQPKMSSCPHLLP